METMIDLQQFDSVNAVMPAPNTSSKYIFIPTREIIDLMGDLGWFPAKVQESYTKKYKGYQKHIVRLRQNNKAFKVGDEFPELILINSHMGSSIFKIMLGIYRLICGNGLVIGDTFFQFGVRHSGQAAELVAESVKRLTELAPKALEQVDRFKGIELFDYEKMEFAKQVVELVNDGDKYIMKPEEVLQSRRMEDGKSDLWTVFNVAQENVIKGGIARTNKAGKSRKTRAVKAIDRNVELNRGLWRIAEQTSNARGLVVM